MKFSPQQRRNYHFTFPTPEEAARAAKRQADHHARHRAQIRADIEAAKAKATKVAPCSADSPVCDSSALDENYSDEHEWCDTCNNLGVLICRCGGDLCVCMNQGEYPCPDCF